MREIWAPRPFICAGGFERDTAFAHSEETGDLIAFGRAYIANVSDNVREKNYEC